MEYLNQDALNVALYFFNFFFAMFSFTSINTKHNRGSIHFLIGMLITGVLIYIHHIDSVGAINVQQANYLLLAIAALIYVNYYVAPCGGNQLKPANKKNCL